MNLLNNQIMACFHKGLQDWSAGKKTCPDGGPITAECLTGSAMKTTITKSTTEKPPSKQQTYAGGGQTGTTSGEMNDDGKWHWGKTVYAEAGNGGWTWVQTPDGDWTLTWVTTNTGNHWLWWMPNRYHWSGSHRRRGTWMHISGPDWRDDMHSLTAHMFTRDDDRGRGPQGGGHHDKDGKWTEGMESDGPMPIKHPEVVTNQRVKNVRAMPTAPPKKGGNNPLDALKSFGNTQSWGHKKKAGALGEEGSWMVAEQRDGSKETFNPQPWKADPLKALEQAKTTDWTGSHW